MEPDLLKSLICPSNPCSGFGLDVQMMGDGERGILGQFQSDKHLKVWLMIFLELACHLH